MEVLLIWYLLGLKLADIATIGLTELGLQPRHSVCTFNPVKDANTHFVVLDFYLVVDDRDVQGAQKVFRKVLRVVDACMYLLSIEIPLTSFKKLAPVVLDELGQGHVLLHVGVVSIRVEHDRRVSQDVARVCVGNDASRVLLHKVVGKGLDKAVNLLGLAGRAKVAVRQEFSAAPKKKKILSTPASSNYGN